MRLCISILTYGKKSVSGKRMNIMITTDCNYAKYYEVMLVSLFENNKISMRIFLLYGQSMTDNCIMELRKLVERYGNEFVAIRMNDEKFSSFPVRNWSVEAYYRLVGFDIVPCDVDRILYLDGDIIINQSIIDFYNTPFEGNYYVACEDLAISKGKNKQEYNNLGFSSDHLYINGGVELINVKKMKEEYNVADIFWYLNQHGDSILYADQTTVNYLFAGKIKYADGLKYNCQASGYHYTEEKKILGNAHIIHFTSLRPWNNSYQKHYSSAISGEVWWQYARKIDYWRKKYIGWKIVNTVQVKPWQICYRLFRLFMSQHR